MSNALYIAAAAIASSQSASQQAMGGPLETGVVAAGICVLAVWVVRTVARPDEFFLRRSPGRGNSLAPGHLLLVFGAYLAPGLAVSRVLGPSQGYQWTLSASVAGQLACAAVALLIADRTFRHGLRRGLGLSMRHWVCDTGRAVAGYLVIVPVCFGLYWAVEFIWPRCQKDIHEFLVLLWRVGPAWKLLIVVSAVVLAPIAEELLFRGLIQSMLRRYLASPWLAVVLTSMLFAGMHMGQPKDAPALAALGVALGYNYERTGRLYPPMLMHALFNAVNMAAFLNAGT